METRVKQVVSSVTGCAFDAITLDSSPDQIEAWDSSTHLTLVMALEEEFGVHFSEQQFVEMMTVGLIVVALSELGIQA